MKRSGLFEQLSPLYKDILQNCAGELEILSKILENESECTPSFSKIMLAFGSEIEPKVLIIGQDPYPNPNHACGLAFSVPGTTPISSLPPTLKNIHRELATDLTLQVLPTTGDLTPWSDKGVLLLNRRLTLSKSAKINKLWDTFTLKTLEQLKERYPSLVVLAWGNSALELTQKIGFTNIIHSPHPSPLSAYRGFIGSKPFSNINRVLIAQGNDPVDWRLP